MRSGLFMTLHASKWTANPLRGMAYLQRLVSRLTESVSWIAPVTVYPGEDELQALMEGALRVLRHEEQSKTLALGCSAVEI